MRLRKAIGAIILGSRGGIIAFQRSDFPETWQCPEGGIDEGETPEEALARELEEEIGLDGKQFEIIGNTKSFIPYLFENGEQKYDFDGQEKMFFLVKLKNSSESFIYNREAEEIEFIDHKTVAAPELIELVPNFKKSLYRSVLEEFGML
ncbi:MAG: NUDIX domain-containing protein [Rickettsiales bacterium]|jgi:putative (di)nucleoside polyphosphate hydrolase|nr:NUDIX domain-containing protein [Rickettsiales bacterium]